MTTQQDDPVVVTGIGVVSAFGWNAEALWQGLVTGKSAIAPAKQFDTVGHRTVLASEVPAPPSELIETNGGGRLSAADRFAVSASREAARRAGLALPCLDHPQRNIGVYFGGSTAGMAEGERFFRDLVGEKNHPRLADLLSQPLNGPGDAVARCLGVVGPVVSISSACSSGTLAVGEALCALRDDEVDIAIAGGADSLCQLTYAGFNALRAVDERPCAPFRKERAGLNLGEGAGVLVLEKRSHATQRGAEILGGLLGAGASCDAHHMTAPSPDGQGAASAMLGAIKDADVSPASVSFVNAHGTGTPLNDASEYQALRTVFEEQTGQIPVTSTKGAVGHLLGSAGALEAVATVLCLQHQLVHPTAGSGNLDPDAAVDLVVDEPRPLGATASALSVNLAFGGANAAVLLASPWLILK